MSNLFLPNARPTKGGISYRVRVSPEVAALTRNAKGHFRSIQGGINAGLRQLSGYVLPEVERDLREKMARNPAAARQNRARPGLRYHLRDRHGDSPIIKLDFASRFGDAGVGYDFTELDRLVLDDNGNPYWRAVEYGYSQIPVAGLFYSRTELRSGGRMFGPDPGLRFLHPRVVQFAGMRAAEFTVSFGGYHYIRDGTMRARKRIRDNFNRVLLDNMRLSPAEERAAGFRR